MSHLQKIWVAMLTSNSPNSGTNNETVLIINEDGRDRLHHTFGDTSQRDQEKGEANLYHLDISESSRFERITPANLTNSSVRIGIRGDDAWAPEHYFVWGESAEDPNTIIPIAMENHINVITSNRVGPDPVFISSDRSEGNISLPLRLIRTGDGDSNIRRLVMLMTTRNASDAGTDSKIELQITRNGSVIVNYDIPDTPQWEQERAQANFYLIPVESNLTKNSIDDFSIRLTIKGTDAWRPDSFFLFGADAIEGRINQLVPLVHMPSWSKGWLSTDGAEGDSSVRLELV